MAHSVELLLDADSDTVIRSSWRALAAAGLPSQARVTSPMNRPHVTLLAAPRIDAAVDEALARLASRFPLPCVIGAPVVFGGPRLTLARLIVPSTSLLAMHEEVYRLCLTHLGGPPYPHSLPGSWTAHVTLGRRFGATEIGAALAVTDATDLPARLVGLRRWDGHSRIEHLLVG